LKTGDRSTAAHPVLQAYFKVENPSDAERLMPLVRSAIFDDPYTTEMCKGALTAVQAKEIELLKERAIASKRKVTKADLESDLENLRIDNIDIDTFNSENLTSLRKSFMINYRQLQQPSDSIRRLCS
jgi:hypothetical protein